MKKKFLIKILSIIFAIGLINSSPALAKVEQNAQQQNIQQQEKKLSKEEEKKQDIATINEALKKIDSLEEQMQKEVKKKFENFKKEDFEVENYNLEVFKKDVSYFLIYTHKKTGAKIYFNLVLDKDKLKQKWDYLTFRAPTQNDKGLIHFLEHCIAIPYQSYFEKKFQITPNDLNAVTSPTCLSIISRVEIFGLNEKIEKEHIKSLTKELNEPSVFKKDDKTFEIEKKRILNELKDNIGKSYESIEIYKLINSRNYTPGGKISELKKTKLKDVKNYYEKYIHPSNCLLIKNVAELNPQKIKNYLNLWHENYFNHYEKKEIKGNKYKPRNKEKFLVNEISKDSNVFTFHDDKKNKNLNFKFHAATAFDFENKLNFKQMQCFELSLEPFKDEIEQFGKNLGYEKIIAGGDSINFFGNKEELFKQKVLETNYKKIMEFITNKLKNLNEKDLFYSYFYDLKNLNKFTIKEMNLKNTNLISDPGKYLCLDMLSKVLDSFVETGKPISEKFFTFEKDKELESSKQMALKYAKENINVYNNFAKAGPEVISVLKQANKTSKQLYKQQKDKYEIYPRAIPIKLKDKNSKKFVDEFAKILLVNKLNYNLNSQKGLIYRTSGYFKYIENNFIGLFKLNKDSVKPFEDYIFKNFNELMKDVNIKEKDLNELKKQYKNNFNSFKKDYEDFFKNEKKTIKDFENYIKTGKVDENSVLHTKEKLKIRDGLSFIPTHLEKQLKFKLSTLYKNYEDYKNLFEKQISFKEKYVSIVNKEATPEIAKDFLENYLKPYYKTIKKAYKLAEKKLKALNSVKFKDVKALIETAYLVEDKNEIEKVNKNIREKSKRFEKLKEKFEKS